MQTVLLKGYVILLKKRLDVILTERGMFSSREKAKASIMAGLIYVDGQLTDKAGTSVSEDAEITVKDDLCPYVSRGGLKLEKAAEVFDFAIEGVTAMDIGASTGGFTDCMLKNGAAKVYAVDVGYGQLDWKLRNDERVINIEKTNIRFFDTSGLEGVFGLISIDVSFISLKLVLPVAATLISEDGAIICLVKPQFEAGREQVGKKGIVRDPAVQRQTIENVISYGKDNGLVPMGLTFSPVTGAKGNIEFLLYLKKGSEDENRVTDDIIDQTVKEAHSELESAKEK